MILTFDVHPSFENNTLRTWLSFFHLSKSTIYKLEQGKCILCQGQPLKLETKLHANDQLTIMLTIFDKAIEPFHGPIDIIYEDDDLIVVNKPPGLLVHSDGQTIDTLTNRLSSYLRSRHSDVVALPVHRIDYEASGIVVFAKHLLALSYMTYLFESRDVQKTYVCKVRHEPETPTGIIDRPIGKDRHANRQIISHTGQPAITHYRVLNASQGQTTLEVRIESGRKHQIRVHLSSIGSPIIGDVLYHGEKHDRMLLHFKMIEFVHMRSLKSWSCTCPESFE